MSGMDRAVAPATLPVQCPVCGVPVGGTTIKVVRVTGSAPALSLEDCGHVITFEAMRDVWGIDIPVPDPNNVRYRRMSR